MVLSSDVLTIMVIVQHGNIVSFLMVTRAIIANDAINGDKIGDDY